MQPAQRCTARPNHLETSGLADPAAIVQAIRSGPVLVHHILVDRVIVAVDTLPAAAQPQAEPLRRHQIATVDHLILTKADATLNQPGPNWSDLRLRLSVMLHARGDPIKRIRAVLRTPASRFGCKPCPGSCNHPRFPPPPRQRA